MRKNADVQAGKIIITNNEERNLALKIAQMSNVIMRSASEKEPSIISDYAYTLAQLFSSFYNASPVKGAETVEIASSRVGLAKLTRDVLTTLLYLLGIEAPEVMPKA
jgi:arginyl-tRNA synthetase